MENKNTTQQAQIIRQSQVKAVLDYFTLIEKKPSLSDVVKTATMMEQYINNGYSKKLMDDFDKVDTHIKENI
jgi:hypothetical protein